MQSDIEEGLVRSNALLLHGDGNTELRDLLLRECPALSSAYIVDWIPEQAEDIYTVVVDGDTILVAEIPRVNAYRNAGLDPPNVTVQRFDTKTFASQLGKGAKLKRRKIAAAQSLATRDRERK
jgi:hypothetical protein